MMAVVTVSGAYCQSCPPEHLLNPIPGEELWTELERPEHLESCSSPSPLAALCTGVHSDMVPSPLLCEAEVGGPILGQTSE